MSNEKKYKKSPVAIICYLLSAAMLIYTCYMIGNTVHTINEYYAQYEMSASLGEYVTYLLQSALDPMVYTVIFFMLGYILDAVRKNNPANFVSEAEIEEAKNAKKEAKDAKQAAKAEAAAAKSQVVVTEENSVEADFEKSFDEAMKKDEEKPKQVRRQPKPKKQNQSGQNGEKKPAEGKSGDDKPKTNAKNGEGRKNNSGSKPSGRKNNSGSRKPSSGSKPKKPAGEDAKAAKDASKDAVKEAPKAAPKDAQKDGIEVVITENSKSEN
jgi:uncharacterized membrane protein